MNYLPVPLPFFWLLGSLLLVVVVLVQIEALRFAYTRLGVGAVAASLILLVSLAGSYVNIPIYALPEQQAVSGREIGHFGMRYVVPVVVDWPRTIVAINLGGAVIPIAISIYLLARNTLWIRGLAATAVVALVCHQMATLVPGLGIAMPSFAPPLVTTVAALLIAPASAPAVAYISGSLGTLIGADLMNLGRIQGLGAPIVSIGGAGTFDGIFITGIVSVLLASLFAGRLAGSGR